MVRASLPDLDLCLIYLDPLMRFPTFAHDLKDLKTVSIQIVLRASLPDLDQIVIHLDPLMPFSPQLGKPA